METIGIRWRELKGHTSQSDGRGLVFRFWRSFTGSFWIKLEFGEELEDEFGEVDNGDVDSGEEDKEEEQVELELELEMFEDDDNEIGNDNQEFSFEFAFVPKLKE